MNINVNIISNYERTMYGIEVSRGIKIIYETVFKYTLADARLLAKQIEDNLKVAA